MRTRWQSCGRYDCILTLGFSIIEATPSTAVEFAGIPTLGCAVGKGAVAGCS